MNYGSDVVHCWLFHILELAVFPSIVWFKLNPLLYELHKFQTQTKIKNVDTKNVVIPK